MPNPFLYIQTVLIQTIQFSISTQFSSIWSIERTLSGATTPGKSGPGSDGNERVLCIPQSSSTTGISSSDCLVSYPEHSLGEGKPYPSAKVLSTHKLRLTCCWSMLVIGSVSARWTTLVFAKSPSTYARWLCWS